MYVIHCVFMRVYYMKYVLFCSVLHNILTVSIYGLNRLTPGFSRCMHT